MGRGDHRARRDRDRSHAVAHLREQLPVTDDDVVLLFDGTRDDRIVVSAGIARNLPGTVLEELHTPAVEQGVSVRFDESTTSVADAWVLIDAELESRQLVSGGIYRQIVSPDGRTTLQAPVRCAR